MTLRPSLPRPHLLAFALALLAILAQLWMAQLSTTHLAQQAFWGEICTVDNSPSTVANPSDPSALAHAANCPVCSVAAASFVPPAAFASLPALSVQALQRQGGAEHLPPVLRHAGLRPPAQAPPAA